MPRRKRNDAPSQPVPSGPRKGWRRWLLQGVGAAVVVTLALAALFWLGDYARDQIRQHERYQVAFTEIECSPPRGLTREEFLEQVQYYGRLPDRFSVLEEGLADKLKSGFAQHPWVARVDRVDLQAPRTVVVSLVFRQPVLAVAVESDLAGPGFEGAPAGHKQSLRAVDAQGILLPRKALLPQGLPVLVHAPRPLGSEGKAWGDSTVEAAAQAAALLLPHQQRLELTRVEATAQGLTFWGKDVKVLWGQDAHGEPAATVKVERLLKAWAERAQAPAETELMVEIDLRPPAGAVTRLVERD